MPHFDADVAIVGGGPAGLSAALVLGRACRRVLLFDDGRYRNHAAAELHGFLSRDGIAPAALRAIARADLAKYESVRIVEAEVASARADDGGFEVGLSDERVMRSRFLLLATGVTDNLPDIPGFAELFGRSVFHCPYCDGWELRGQPLAVYGCEQRAFGLALELTGWTSDIVICSDGQCGIPSGDIGQLERNGIRIMEQRIAGLEHEQGRLTRIAFADGSSLERSAIFFTTGQTQSSVLAKSLGCEFNDKGTVRTGPYETTSIPGLFVAGDASRSVQWVVVAAAEGAEAAYAINQQLIKEQLTP